MVSMSIWKDKIVLRTDLLTLNRHPELVDHARYNEKFQAYLLTFSAQNLIRIRQAFGEIPVSSGLERINSLRLKFSEYMSMCKTAQEIKDAASLPDLEYKMPPLGLYQHRGVHLLTRIPRVPLFVDCGCLAGDSVLRYNRAGISRKATIARMYQLIHDVERPGRQRDPSIVTRVRSYNGAYIGLNPIKDIKKQGLKEVFNIVLKDGKTIKATKDHEFLTDSGWLRLDQLVLGLNSIMVDNLSKHQGKCGEKRAPRKLPDKRIAVGQYHPYARKQTCHNGSSFSYLVEIHRVLYEAHINGLDYTSFIKRTYSGEGTDMMKFVNTKTECIHHINGNHYDNRPENLEVIGKSAHMRRHTRGYVNFEHGIPKYSEVVSITAAGSEMTYDIICEDPHRNFVANGMVVHNCGKTYMAAVATEKQIQQGVIAPGETLVCGKLATLETGWMDDISKFTNLKANLLWLPGTSKRKEKLLKILDDPADIYITNHNTLAVLEDALAAKRFKKIIVDESTVLKSYHGDFTRKGGSLGKALMRIAEHAEWRVIMSGTPAPNGPHDLWGQFRFIDPDGFTLEASYQDFKERYMEEIFFGKADGPETPSTWINRPESIKEVGDKIAPLSYQIKIRDHLHDLPEKTVIRRSIPMGEDQQKHYLDMREKLATIINDEFVAIDVKLAQLSKLRQITGGFLIDQEEEVHPIEDATKLEAMDDLLDEIGDYKVVIYAQFQWEIKTLAERYKERGVVTVFGANRSQDNLANIKAFINNPEVKVIILHPKSAAHGVTFTVSHYMVFYSISFSAEDDYQCVARIERASQRHPMFIYYLIAKMNGAKKRRDEEKKEITIDEIIYQVLQKKTRDQNQLLDQRVIDMEILKQI